MLDTTRGNQDSPSGESTSTSGGVNGISSAISISLLATSSNLSTFLTSSSERNDQHTDKKLKRGYEERHKTISNKLQEKVFFLFFLRAFPHV